MMCNIGGGAGGGIFSGENAAPVSLCSRSRRAVLVFFLPDMGHGLGWSRVMRMGDYERRLWPLILEGGSTRLAAFSCNATLAHSGKILKNFFILVVARCK